MNKMAKYWLSSLLMVGSTYLMGCSNELPIDSKDPAPAVSTETLKKHVKTLSVDFFPRNYDTRVNLNKSADYIKQYLLKYSDKATEQIFTVNGETYRNIIARFGSENGDLMVVGAHYDSYGDTYGADDNASGVAGLLELARLLKENPPDQPVELVAYSLEEPPFFGTDNMGSAFHARALKASDTKVKLMLSLEMIGYFNDAPNSQQYPLAFMKKMYSDKGNFIGVIGNMSGGSVAKKVTKIMNQTTNLTTYRLNAPSSVKGIDFSDHRNYWAEGYPALMITNTSFYRNQHYHESHGDDWQSLDYDRMAKVVQGVYKVVMKL